MKLEVMFCMSKRKNVKAAKKVSHPATERKKAAKSTGKDGKDCKYDWGRCGKRESYSGPRNRE